MKLHHFQKFNPIDLLIEERFFRKIRKLKSDTKLKTLSLNDGDKPAREWINKTYTVIINKYPELKGWANSSELIPDKEHINYLKSNNNSRTNNIIPTEYMTNTKLAILESGFASIEKIKRPAERRLALQDLQKEMKVSPKEFNCLIQFHS